MKLTSPISVQELSQLIDCVVVGEQNNPVLGFNEIHMVEPGDVVFVDHPKYYEKALKSAATIVLIDKVVEAPEGKTLLVCEKPFDAYNFLTKHFAPTPFSTHQHHPSAFIHPSAKVHPSAFIDKDVHIGAETEVHAGAAIMSNSWIGERVIIGPNAVVGHSAFYYKRKTDGYERMHSCGSVRLEDDVEVGACCTIDKGVSGVTHIGKGSKLDNHVHIGHDTYVGKHVLMAAHVGIAGCTRIEDRVILWGQVGCASDVTIGEGAIVLAQSGISKNLEGGKTYFGSPAGDVKEKFKEMAALRRLPDVLKGK